MEAEDGGAVQVEFEARLGLLEKIFFHNFDSSQKSLLEFKASLIAAKAVKRVVRKSCVLARYFKNIQPISVGV